MKRNFKLFLLIFANNGDLRCNYNAIGYGRSLEYCAYCEHEKQNHHEPSLQCTGVKLYSVLHFGCF
jgi:hypothetical protein